MCFIILSLNRLQKLFLFDILFYTFYREVYFMVNVFIIHSNTNKNFIEEEVVPFLYGMTSVNDKSTNYKCNANILTLKKRKLWKPNASKKIREAQIVIVVIGEDSNLKYKKKTMGWEVKKARKYNKQIYIYNIKNYDMPNYLYCTDPFTKQTRLISEPTNLQTIKERIDNFANGYYNIFSSHYNSMDITQKKAYDNVLMEQYKLFQKTSEDLVTRRQSVNSFYISLNTALVTFIGVVLGLLESPLNTIVMIAMCSAGIILDISWIKILDSYGILNSAKMKVISLLEAQLPIALYDSEWKIMSDKLNNKKYVSFTDSEKRIPKLFLAIYFLAVLVSVGFLIYFLIS